MRMTIYEILVFCKVDNIAIDDDNFPCKMDIGCEVNKKKCKSGYDKLMRFFCTHIELSNYQPKWYSNAFVSEFIRKHIQVFNTFMNEENAVDFRPNEYEEITAELFHFLYMQTFERLVKGCYSDEQYTKLFNLLKEEEENGKQRNISATI